MLTDHITAVFERTVTASFARRGEKWWLCLSPRNQTGPATRPWSPFVTSWPASRSNAMCRLHYHEFFLFRLSEVERWPWLPPLPGNVYTKVGNKMCYFPGHLRRVGVVRVTVQPPFCVARSTSSKSPPTQAMSSHGSFAPALQPYSGSCLESPVVQPREQFHSPNAYEAPTVLYVE